jgi:hypothetical protein
LHFFFPHPNQNDDSAVSLQIRHELDTRTLFLLSTGVACITEADAPFEVDDTADMDGVPADVDGAATDIADAAADVDGAAADVDGDAADTDGAAADTDGAAADVDAAEVVADLEDKTGL